MRLSVKLNYLEIIEVRILTVEGKYQRPMGILNRNFKVMHMSEEMRVNQLEILFNIDNAKIYSSAFVSRCQVLEGSYISRKIPVIEIET